MLSEKTQKIVLVKKDSGHISTEAQLEDGSSSYSSIYSKSWHDVFVDLMMNLHMTSGKHELGRFDDEDKNCVYEMFREYVETAETHLECLFELYYKEVK